MKYYMAWNNSATCTVNEEDKTIGASSAEEANIKSLVSHSKIVATDDENKMDRINAQEIATEEVNEDE